MARLAGKVAFITGGGGGIGRATAERFAEEGAKVVIAEIDKERGEAAAQSARALARNSGGDAHFIHCDIRDKANVEAAFAQTVERFGKLTILHNNAGGSTPQDGPVTDAPEEEFWRVINLDLYGTFLCSKIGIPHIIKSGGGAIINMTSSLAARLDDVRNTDLGAKKSPIEIKIDDAPEFLFRRVGDLGILRCGSAGVVVKDRQFSKPLHSLREGRLDVRLVADVAVNEMRIAARIPGERAGRLSGGLATLLINLGDDDLRTFFGKALGGGTANAATASVINATFPASRAISPAPVTDDILWRSHCASTLLQTDEQFDRELRILRAGGVTPSKSCH